MAAVFLGEKLSRAQIAAVGLAAFAVMMLTVEAGGLPWISLALATLLRHLRLPAQDAADRAEPGLLPRSSDPQRAFPRLCHLAAGARRGAFRAAQPDDILLLLCCGPATAAPLLLYGFGAKLLRFSTIGLMQYIAPTMVFLIAVFVFHEPFGAWKMVAFALIWTALALYSWSMFSGRAAAGADT